MMTSATPMTSSTPIRRTLMRMIFLASGAVLAVTTISFCTYEFLTFRQSSTQQLEILSQAIASNSTAALAFDNADDATVGIGGLQGRSAYHRRGPLRCARQDFRGLSARLDGEAFAGEPRA